MKKTDFTKLPTKALIGIIDCLADYFHTKCVEEMPLDDFYSMAHATWELYLRKRDYLKTHQLTLKHQKEARKLETMFQKP